MQSQTNDSDNLLYKTNFEINNHLRFDFIKLKENNYKNFNPIYKIYQKPETAQKRKWKRPNSQPNFAANSLKITNNKNSKLEFLQKVLNLQTNYFTASYILKKYYKVLTKLEIDELNQMDRNTNIYYLGNISIRELLYSKNKELDQKQMESSCINSEIGDHINYQYEIQEIVNIGTYGKMLKCLDHKNNLIVHIKVIKKIKEYFYQSNIEIRLLQHIKQKNFDNKINIIKMITSFVFRGHNV